MQAREKKTKPAPHSAEELEHLVGVVRSISDFPRMSKDEQEDLIESLLDYECYAQVIQLLKWRTQDPSARREQVLEDYCNLMKIYHEGLEDFDKVCEIAKACVRQLKLPFATVRLHLVERTLHPEDYQKQARLYHALSSAMPDAKQRVFLLCRLALIIEKKLFRESEVEPIYATIVKLDPYNIKALRFYRMWYGQEGDWEKAARQLQLLIQAYRYPQEKQRAAHELAQIYLYNMNKPELALETLDRHCSESPLDTSQTMVESLERLGLFEELITRLEHMSENAQTGSDRASILLKTGLIFAKIGQQEEARKRFTQALQIEPDHLQTHEALITSLIQSEQTEALTASLKQLVKHIKNRESRQRILQMTTELEALAGSSRSCRT